MPLYLWNQYTKPELAKVAQDIIGDKLSDCGFEVKRENIKDHGFHMNAQSENGSFLRFQVRSCRFPAGMRSNYIFTPKSKFTIDNSSYMSVVLFVDEVLPDLYLIPSRTWEQPNKLFKDYDYGKPGQKSAPEWGIYITRKNLQLLSEFKFENILDKLSS
ncbi:MAG: hypothetical protein ABJA67_09900 [Chthonomonadales bacterium]